MRKRDDYSIPLPAGDLATTWSTSRVAVACLFLFTCLLSLGTLGHLVRSYVRSKQTVLVKVQKVYQPCC